MCNEDVDDCLVIQHPSIWRVELCWEVHRLGLLFVFLSGWLVAFLETNFCVNALRINRDPNEI